MAYEKAERDEIIGNIVLAEWTLFQAVQNVGGRADCQDMPNTFSAMRPQKPSRLAGTPLPRSTPT